MSTSRLARLRSIFDSIVAQPESSRSAALDEACGDDETLRRDLVRLLDAFDDPSSLYEKPAAVLAGVAGPDGTGGESVEDNEGIAGRVGDRIGPYELVDVLGRGGMGVVYRARSTEPAREVALKVVGGPVDEDRAARLEREARLLAGLAHPGIVPMFEQGRTPDGAPWFAMEMIDGAPLDEFVRDGALGREDRLALFLELCAAIEYAHQKGVVHRDLKPANILVRDAESEHGASVRVLDFGLAARVSGLELTLSTRLTEPGRLLGTLAYMSPEQARSEDVDQRTDVYALGVILYELLTDARPIDIEGSWIVEAMERIADAVPRRPRAIDPTIGRDLDAVVMTALAKDPDARIQSVSGLAEDVRRALEHRPVLVRPPRFTELAIASVRRRPVGAAAALAAFVMVVLTGGAWAAREFDHAAALREQLESAEAVMRFQDRLFDGNGAGEETLLTDVIDRAAGLLDAFADRPRVRASLEHTLGRTYDALGDYEAAEPHLESALASRRALLGELHVDTLDVRLAWAVHRLQSGEPLDAVEIAAALEEDARAAHGGDARFAWSARAVRATGLRLAGRLDEALPLYRSAYEALLEHGGVDDEETLRAGGGFVAALRLNGDIDAAETLLSELLPRARAALGEDSDVTMNLVNNLTRLYQSRGRLDEAESLQREIIAARREILGGGHPLVLTALNNLSSILYAAGSFAEAAAALEDVLARKEAQLGRDNPSTLVTLGNVAVMHSEAGDHESAIRMMSEVVDKYEVVYGADSYQALSVAANLAPLLLRAGQSERAVEVARDVAESCLRALGGTHPDTQYAWTNLGSILKNLGRLDEAIEALEKSVELCDAAGPSAANETQWARLNLAVTLRATKRAAEALEVLETVLAVPEAERTQERGFASLLSVAVGNTYLDLAQAEDAVPSLSSGLEGLKHAFGPRHVRTLEAARSLHRALELLGRDQEAAEIRSFIELGEADG